MIILWGRSDSTNVRKVLWCLHELNLPFQQIQAGGTFGIIHSDEYLALNPNRLVPCLEDDELVLWESNTIVKYLAEKYGQEQLFIQDIKQRYTAEKWIDWCLSTLSPIFKTIILHAVRLPIEQRDPQRLQTAIAEFELKLSILDQQLQKKTYIADTHFSIADIILGSYVYSWKSLALATEKPQPTLHSVERWFTKLSQRPALQAAIQLKK